MRRRSDLLLASQIELPKRFLKDLGCEHGIATDVRQSARAGRRPVWHAWSAKRTLSGRQAVVGGTALALGGIELALNPYSAGAFVLGVLTIVFLFTTALRIVYLVKGYRARLPRGSRESLASHPLPSYSVLVPLYREAAVAQELFRALDQLDYPFDRIEVLLLCEADDPETIEVCEKHLRPGWRVVVVPKGHPRTKPRALNDGLREVAGEFFTIYDAEDRPDADQLRKAVAQFRALPDSVACLQARLDYYNPNQNLLTRWFTCEYATHFGLYLEGISALGHPMPLGGTSCHFRTEVVRALGGWDDWNVTEDCELGMRLAAAGYDSRTLDSVTWEEAVPVLGKWIRQRSRWVKGFAQTALVLLRQPIQTTRAMGLRRYLAGLGTVGSVPLVLTSQVLFWMFVWVYVGLRTGGVDVSPIEAVFPEPFLSLGMLSLLVGNFAILLAHVSVVYQQQRFELVRYALFIPVYWLLTSIGAWRGVAQLIRRPHFWEKTMHGLAAKVPTVAPEPATEEIVVRPATVATERFEQQPVLRSVAGPGKRD
jgi:cellulose synthase/poly-beta-1,6-N-acetylglucosamine synthase-like glycosyltransferase